MGKIYSKLALTSIRKNRAFYVPYIISSGIMIALFFIVTALTLDPYLREMHGGLTLIDLLNMGVPVVALLSLIFIFYISSFIMKRRKKELGLYSVLGMEKKHIIAIVSRENFVVATLSILFGIILGLIFKKISQLVLLKITHSDADFGFDIPWKATIVTVLIFAVIFFVVSVASSAEILLRSTLGYLKSGNAGEKKPKANWFVGILGMAVLATGYALACAVDDAVSAFTFFFPAVILVIIGTYLVFVAGSVLILHIMKKNKNYYYKTEHMISVSGMIYRMKRNGMGLATICILSTMVLVMISSVTTVLFLNQENMNKQYPYDFCASAAPVDYSAEKAILIDPEILREEAEETASRTGCEIKDFDYYYLLGLCAVVTDGNNIDFWQDFEDYYNVYVMDLDSYNRVTDQTVELEEGQIGFYCENIPDILGDEITIANRKSYSKIDLPAQPEVMLENAVMTYSRADVFLVVSDLDELVSVDRILLEKWNELFMEDGGPAYWNLSRVYTEYNIEGDDREFFIEYGKDHLQELSEEELTYMNTNWGRWEDGTNENVFSKVMFVDYFYSLYGGLFFLGILLSVACITIAVLVMYFKQILEGYEDAGRFSIMKKVGLSNEDIKKTIYSQIVIVFVLPLLTAGIHTAFAYKMVKRMLILFGVNDATSYFTILLISVLLFSVFYGIVFMITGKNYFRIVGDADKAYA